jgi:hypothetical protein
MDVAAVITGAGAVATGLGGTLIVVRELRRKDRLEMKDSMDEMSTDLAHLREDLLACRRYCYRLMEILAEHGMESPPMPPLHHLGDDEPPAG